jgi:GntR family transcriptional regulator
MQIQINNASARPVFQQIIDQVKLDIALGRLASGDRLPTVRELAATLAINPNTIAKAYGQLQQEGIITTRAGAGAFVAGMDSGLTRTVKRKMICEDLEHVVVEAFHMQIDRKTLTDWFEGVVDRFDWSSRDKGSSNG